MFINRLKAEVLISYIKHIMYKWRTLSDQQRQRILDSRRKSLRPWHGPPYFASEGKRRFHLAAACYEHVPIIGISYSRMEEFERRLLQALSGEGSSNHAWCVLPNHWHALIETEDLKGIVSRIGTLHGAASYHWNGMDEARGRKCWHRCSDRRIRSDRHYYASRNYIHHNPVSHGYVEKWEDWPFSSASDHIAKLGREAVMEEWKKYPILDMGKGWDD